MTDLQQTEWISKREEKTPQKIAGAVGEKELFSYLLKYSNGLDNTALISNSSLYVPEGKKKWLEVDVVMVHSSGIYVFENKYFSGTLTGKISDRLWMKTSDTTITIQNPIIQNKNHIKALAQYLSLPENIFKSVIVFAGNCDISGCPASSSNFIITHLSDLSKSLDSYINEEIIQDKSVEEIYKNIMKCATTKEKVVNEHLNYVNSIRKRKKEDKKR